MTNTTAGQGFHAESEALRTAANTHMPQQVNLLDRIKGLLSGRHVPTEAFAKVSGSSTAASGHHNAVEDGLSRLRGAISRLGDWIGGVNESDEAYQRNDQSRAQQTDQVARGAQPAADTQTSTFSKSLPDNVPSWGPTGPPPDDGRSYNRAQIDDWIDQARDVMAQNGTTISDRDADRIAGLIQHESSNNPHAINLWDSNALAGHPSKGLMQTIDSTFDEYHLPGHDNIYDPVDNIIAGTRYGIDQYHSIGQIPGVRAVEHGRGYVGY